MKTLNRISVLFCLAAAAMFGQINSMTQTTISNAINASVQTFNVASATNVLASFTVSTMFYVDREAMLVNSITGTTVTVARGQLGTVATAHAAGEAVLLGRPDWFYPDSTRAFGACTASLMYVTPFVDVKNGIQWLCGLGGYFVAGWQNTTEPAGVTAAVASAAGLITPSGPLFHVTGALAITGFNIPLGFQYGSFTIIPDAAYTTTATNNIALASTGVISKAQTWTFDSVTAKFYPSY